ncbi:hypothetical protein ANN_18424 [Periplaneta americana]|uniref:DUF4817 domain-containing protein n=1 Tax=Periplaneta americana TaxID=6978 RepID=A0ABQ8SNQ8_PERAM|nr:hypothetical protein ANN_18424 [Periplaneta americana]
MDLREVGYGDRDWINLAQDRDRWRAYVRAAMNLRNVKERILFEIFLRGSQGTPYRLRGKVRRPSGVLRSEMVVRKVFPPCASLCTGASYHRWVVVRETGCRNGRFLAAQRLFLRYYNIHRNDPIPSAHAIKIWIQNFEVTGSALKKKSPGEQEEYGEYRENENSRTTETEGVQREVNYRGNERVQEEYKQWWLLT